MVDVPTVTRRRRRHAKQLLQQAGLTVTVIEQDVTDPTQDGLVLAQTPTGGQAPAGLDRDDHGREARDRARSRRRPPTTTTRRRPRRRRRPLPTTQTTHGRRPPRPRPRRPPRRSRRLLEAARSRCCRAGAPASTRSRSPRPAASPPRWRRAGAEVIRSRSAARRLAAGRGGAGGAPPAPELEPAPARTARSPRRSRTSTSSSRCCTGPFGEDGTVQGLLELAGVPYVGAGVDGLGARDGQGPLQVGPARQRHPGHAQHHAAPRRRRSRTRSATRVREAGAARLVGRHLEGPRRRRARGRGRAGVPATTRRCSWRSSSTGSRSRSACSATATPSRRCPARSWSRSNEWYDYEAKYDEGEMELVVPARVTRRSSSRARRSSRCGRSSSPTARAWPASTCSSARTARCS